ncbi:MAG TPA: SHOCT domain-containing protein [Acidimicrobiia bacterium]|nr:SHOCT domain-containing protein [Acidimicrobiia bacterium]
MPGLMRGVARTAVIAGTATAVSNRVSRRQANRWQDQAEAEAYEQQQAAAAYQPPPAAPQGPSQDDKLAQLKQLGELKTAGVLTEAEFEAQKAKILAG